MHTLSSVDIFGKKKNIINYYQLDYIIKKLMRAKNKRQSQYHYAITAEKWIAQKWDYDNIVNG